MGENFLQTSEYNHGIEPKVRHNEYHGDSNCFFEALEKYETENPDEYACDQDLVIV